MPRLIQTPPKLCEFCGNVYERRYINGRLEDRGVFLKRKFCCLSCSVSAQHATPPPTEAAARKRTKRFIGVRCDSCGHDAGLCMHHVNGNPMDNTAQNLQTLCTYCHSVWHATLKRLNMRPLKPMPRLIEWDDCAPTATRSSRKSPRSSSEPPCDDR